jgi:hypothetical protein
MKKGEIVQIIGNGVLAGLRAKVIRISPRTGNLTVELIDEWGCWEKGDKVSIGRGEWKILKTPDLGHF